jgi:hypothetical protein
MAGPKFLPAPGKKMQTNYQNLTAFEAAAVGMVVLGLALIGVQAWVVLPDQAKSDIVDALQVLDANDAWATQMAVNEFVIGGVAEFNRQFYLSAVEVLGPVVTNAQADARRLAGAFESFLSWSDTLASNYQNNYALSGVEAGVGGRVLGEYIDKVTEQ